MAPGLGHPGRHAEFSRRAGVLSGMSRLAEDGFARAALQSGCRFSAGLAEARALMATGRPQEAERALGRLVPAGPAEAVKLALLRARNLFWALDRPAMAEAVLRTAELAAGDNAAELHALRARFAFAQGDPRAALTLAEPIESCARATDAARVRAAVALAEALAVCGRRDEAVAVARRWEALALRRVERQFAAAQGLAHWLAGDLDPAGAEAERAYAAADDPQGAAVSALLLGHVWLSRRSFEPALRWFRESSVLLRSSDPVRMRPAALAGIAQVAAQTGNAAHARAVIAELDRLPHTPGRFVGEELGIARAWVAHVSGEHAEAIRIVTAVADDAEARGADGFATRARQELTRLHP